MKFVAIFLIIISVIGCGGTIVYETPQPIAGIQPLTCSYVRDFAVGVTKPAIESNTARLIYSEQSIQGLLTGAVSRAKCFRMVDAKTIRDVISRHLVEESEFGTEEGRKKIAAMLKADYFLNAAIVDFVDEVAYPNNTMSKAKLEKVTVSMEFILKNAFTNEVLITVSSNGSANKSITYTSGFGAGGTANRELSRMALSSAINSGVSKMVYEVEGRF